MQRMIARLISGTVLLSAGILATGQAHSASFNSLDALSQGQFKTLSENIGASIQYKGITPAEPLGVLGLDVGASLSYTSIDEQIFDAASEGDFDVSGLILPRVSLHKGLPFGIDIGASLTGAPGTDIKVLGAEIRYAIMQGGVATPAIGVRASYSVLQGVDEFDMSNAGLDVSISKGFVMFTPYAGAGIVRTTSTPKNAATLREEEIDQQKVFVGLNINLGINFTLEADQTGDYTSYNVKTGFRF